MEFTPLFNLILALVILLTAAGVYLALHLKNLQAQIEKLCYHLYFEVTKKSDLIPQFLVRMSPYIGSDKWDEIISLRQQSMQITACGKGKKELETSLWEKFESLRKTALALPEAKKDLALLALEKEKNEAEARLTEVLNTYNHQVKKYNFLARNILLKPVVLLIKAKPFESF